MTGRPETARALVLTAPRQIGSRDLEVPRPETSCALLRVEACGLCGTDHEMYTGHLPAAVPLVPGHEKVGVIEEVSQGAAARWQVGVGDRVAIECFQSCRRCQPCRTGVYRCCEENGLGTAYGLSPLDTPPSLHGGWAEYHWLGTDTMLVPVPEELEPVDATLFNPVGAGIRWGAELPATGPEEVVDALGPGIRELASPAAVREADAAFVMVTDKGAGDHPRLETAAGSGVDLVVDVDDQDPVQALRSAAGVQGADVVVDVTANSPSALSQAVDLAAVGGRIVLTGTRNSTETPGFRPDVVIYKELRLIGALGVDTTAYRQALELVVPDQYPFRSVTRRVAQLDEVDDLPSTMAGESDGAPPVHAVLVPWAGR